MDITIEILKWLALLIFLLGIFLLLNSIKEKWDADQDQAYNPQGESSRSRGDSHTDSDSYSDKYDELERQLDEFLKANQRQKENEIRKLIEKDPELVRDLMRAGNISLPSNKPISDPETLKRIAEQISNELLRILQSATSKDIVDLDLKSGSKLVESQAGGEYMDVAPLKKLDQIPQLRPDEFAYPDLIRNHRILTNQAFRNRFFHIMPINKILYVLEDESGSMQEPMGNGTAKWLWSRGVVIKLTRQAMKGKSKFIYRSFDGSPKPAIKVTTPQEATSFFKHAISISPSGGGTHIFSAFQRAVEDINSDINLTEAAILIISDGEDASMDDTKRVKQMLGQKIHLHVILISQENESLKNVATSYQVIS